MQVEAVVSDFVQVDHLADVLGGLSGDVLSGQVDPSMLAFEDVDGEGATTQHMRQHGLIAHAGALVSCVC